MPASDDYLPEITVDEFLTTVDPWIRSVIDEDRLAAFAAQMHGAATEFDDNNTGRGDSYRLAQSDADARNVGICQLLDATAREGVVLDAFGGDGLIADLVRRRGITMRIITADLSAPMVAAAVRRGLPAVRQSADAMILSDASVDAVLMAYGTHHLAPGRRVTAYVEAARVLRPSGRLVVHDFCGTSNTARWFHDIVDRYAPGGHRYTHFTAQGLASDLHDAGFADVQVTTLYDPIRITRSSADEAALALVRYMTLMYGLTAAVERHPRGGEWLLDVCTSIFRQSAADVIPPARAHLSVYSTASGYVAELPRVALMAIART